MPTYLSPGVYVEEKPAGSAPIEGVGTAVAAFVGIAMRGPINQPTLISNWKQFVDTFGDFTPDGYLAHAVYGYFLNGGGNCFVVRIATDGEKPALAETSISAPETDGKQPERFTVRALQAGDTGGAISVEVADATDGGEDTFKLIVRRGGKVEEQHDNLSGSAKGRQSAAATVKAASQLIELIEAANAPPVRPANGTATLVSAVATPARLEPSHYVGDVADRTGFGGLETIDEITMVCVPDVMAAYQKGAIDLEGVKAVQLAMIAHCELMADRVAIIDPPPDMSPQAVLKWRQEDAGYDSKYATLYWPWIKVYDPASNANVFIPPSGHMAGIWGRNDDTRGVHKAPANEVVRGVLTVGSDLTSREQELLNPVGINCIRSFPGRGIRVWGARTLAQTETEWRYINVRRLFNYLEESILNGTQWVVFEPNDPALWARVRRTITAFLTNEWRKGALFGLTPDEAFYVKCDTETNPPDVVDAGQLVCEIGVAPVKPAEFVIFRLSQFSGGAALTE
jgi:phage tail sheath protein FI